MNKIDKIYILKFLLLVVSGVATFGSLYFSEILKLPPCSLCWYQRLFMFPFFLITLLQIIRDDFEDLFFQFVFGTVGLAIAIYHNLLYYNFIENIVPCSQGVSCTSKQIEWFGFVTIPLLSLIAFVFILALCIIGFFLKGSYFGTKKTT